MTSTFRVVGDDPPAGGCPWQAAVTRALADGAVRGVLIYETADDRAGRVVINLGRASLRGVLEEELDELLGE